MMFEVWMETRRSELRRLIRSYEERRKPSDRRWIESKLEAYDEIVREVNRRNWVVSVTMAYDNNGEPPLHAGKEEVERFQAEVRGIADDLDRLSSPDRALLDVAAKYLRVLSLAAALQPQHQETGDGNISNR